MCPRGAGAHFQIRRDIGGRRENRGLWMKRGPGSVRNLHAATSPPPAAGALLERVQRAHLTVVASGITWLRFHVQSHHRAGFGEANSAVFIVFVLLDS